MRCRSAGCATLAVQPSKQQRAASPELREQPGTVRQARAFAAFAWGFPVRGSARAGSGGCAVSRTWAAPLGAVPAALGHCHPQPKSWSSSPLGQPSSAPACLSTFTQPCAGVMHLLQNSFWSGDSRDTIPSVWDLRSVCQTVSVKTSPVLTSSQAHTPDSQLTSRKGAEK